MNFFRRKRRSKSIPQAPPVGDPTSPPPLARPVSVPEASIERKEKELDEKIEEKIIEKPKLDTRHARANSISKCTECTNDMPHISARRCKCHDMSCSHYKPEMKGHCTIFRKLSIEGAHA